MDGVGENDDQVPQSNPIRDVLSALSFCSGGHVIFPGTRLILESMLQTGPHLIKQTTVTGAKKALSTLHAFLWSGPRVPKHKGTFHHEGSFCLLILSLTLDRIIWRMLQYSAGGDLRDSFTTHNPPSSTSS